ncbi:hypothetical protein SLEP1_g18942 [Rubroshorea leprosula]|uniref:BED-type domain-containing protein n=1 Tax=Rubroshorea leprosula TaxID=152421 RepID=A0AAV5J842_9ROSI|nr:hypothetical protein SLEP1_g18942 [Rubroshorea leprosula]
MEEMKKTKGKQTEEDDEEYKEDLEEEEEEDDEEDDIDDSLGKSSEGNITRAKESTTNRTKKRGRVSQKNQPPEVNEQSQPQGTQRKPRGKTSEAWKYFVCFIGPDGKQKGRCKWCSAVIRACSSNNGTSGLKKHITRCKLNPENLKKQAQLKLTKFTTIDGGKAVHLAQWKFDGVASRKDAVAFEEIDFKKNVCLDVRHRWNSSNDMLQKAEKLSRQEKTFKDELNAPSAPGIPDFEDWENIRRLTRFLEHFYLFALKVSGSWYCTINLLLHELCEINTLINKWESSKEDDLAAVAWNMKEKFAKYRGDPTKMHKNIFFAVVLDPSQKMGYLNCLLGELYSESEGKAKEYGCWIEAELRKLFDFYKTEIENQNENCGSNSTNATSGSSGGQGPDQNNLNHLVGSKQSGGNGLGGVASLRANRNGNVSSCQSEPGNKKGMKDTERFRRYLSKAAQEKNEQSKLDIYLKDKLEIMENDAQFYDVLSFWRLKSGRFPVLATMARDILANLVSTVASESAFSTSGRVLDDFRSSLTPKMAQALVFTQDWLRKKKRKHVNITLDCEDLDELEEAEAEYRKKLRSSLLDG